MRRPRSTTPRALPSGPREKIWVMEHMDIEDINAIGTLVLATSIVLVSIAQISARLGKPGKDAT